MTKISISKNRLRWLFAGVGFHNSEASMTPIMSEEFKNEVVLKTMREISPTYTRVFAGYFNWTKEAMDAFADYYDQTFRQAGTLVYMVPGRMPYMTEDFDPDSYSEKVASNLDYLINVRNCKKIRYYCATNELSVGNTYAYLSNHLELLKEIHESLYKAFRRHNLDIGLLATDCSGTDSFHQIHWAIENMDEVTECYCAHLYSVKYLPGDLRAYQFYIDAFSPLVAHAHRVEKRFVLGEYGLTLADRFSKMPMRNDVSYSVDMPEIDPIYAIALVEMGMAAINSGCMAAVMWTLFDYPDPFIREDGDTKEEKARYDVARFSGHGLDIRYNKNGLIRWCEDETDHSARAGLYTMGYFAKLFKKGSRVLECKWDDEGIRCCAVTNADGSVSIALINWNEEECQTAVTLEHKTDKPLRRYEYRSDNVPYNPFNDLQPLCGLIEGKDNGFEIVLPGKSLTFLTTDYRDRIPAAVTGIQYNDGKLTWDQCLDEEHAYYRIYRNGVQIASTVAEYTVCEEDGKFEVYSVDKYGNCAKGKEGERK